MGGDCRPFLFDSTGFKNMGGDRVLQLTQELMREFVLQGFDLSRMMGLS